MLDGDVQPRVTRLGARAGVGELLHHRIGGFTRQGPALDAQDTLLRVGGPAGTSGDRRGMQGRVAEEAVHARIEGVALEAMELLEYQPGVGDRIDAEVIAAPVRGASAEAQLHPREAAVGGTDA